MLLNNNIIKENHPNIRKISKDVKLPLNRSDKLLASNLLNYVRNSQDSNLRNKYKLTESVGIAAIQVNINKKMFALYFNDFDQTTLDYVVINPTITYRSNELIYLDNGEDCLSVSQKQNGLVMRHLTIKFNGYLYFPDEDKLVIADNMELTGYKAIVFQHEFDHTCGILYIDKLTNKPAENAISLSQYLKENNLG